MKKRFPSVVTVELVIAAIGCFAINCVYIRTQTTTVRSEQGVPCTVHVYKGVNRIYIASDDYACGCYLYEEKPNEVRMVNSSTYANLGNIAVQATRDTGGIVMNGKDAKVDKFDANAHRENGVLVLNVKYPNYDKATLRIAPN